MFVAIVPAQVAAQAIKELLDNDLVDRTMKIQRSGSEVFVPLTCTELPRRFVDEWRISIQEWDDRRRIVREAPYKEIGDSLRKQGLDGSLLSLLTNRWEMLGDVLILKLHNDLLGEKQKIAKAYADVLGAKTVLRDLGNIRGEGRVPEMEILLGESTEAIQCENGILYSLDAAKIMFSSGNTEERTRMASIECPGETILDMFAGIGYLSLPVAVYGKPKRIYACEIRELTYDYLVKNIKLNRVEEVMVPVLKDNRDFDPPIKVDRIIMGYLRDTHEFIPKALACLRSGGIMHYHENFPNAILPGAPIERLRDAAGSRWRFEILRERVVKTYAPGVSHMAIDVRFTSI